MKLDFDEFKKAWENPFHVEHTKAFRKNMVDGISKASQYHTHFVKGGVEAMNRMHDWWIQGIDWYIDSHNKMTTYVTERIETKDTET